MSDSPSTVNYEGHFQKFKDVPRDYEGHFQTFKDVSRETRLGTLVRRFSTFSGQLHATHLLLRAFLEGTPSKIVLKVYVSDEAVLEKSKKHCTGAPQSHQVL